MIENNKNHFWIRLLLIAIFLINGILYIPKQAVLADERHHASYAFRLVKGQPEKTRPYEDASTMPVSALNTLPRLIQQVSNPRLIKTDDGVSDILNGRYITLLFSALIGLYILKWTKELYGENAATFSLFLFVFCPSLNAHAGFFTTDAYAALFTIVPCYYFWKWHQEVKWKHLVCFSIGLGVAQLTKQSLTNLIFIFIGLSILLQWNKQTLFKNPQKKFLQVFAIVGIVLFVINIGFLFRGTFLPLSGYDFKSHSLINLRAQFSFIQDLPLPLPTPYLQGLDLVKHMTELNPGDDRVSYGNYMYGVKKSEGGFWYYYLVILLFKTPLPVLFAAIVLLAQAPHLNRKGFFQNEFVIIATIIYFFIFFNFLVKRQVGVRHILIIYPLFYVLAGRIILLFKPSTLKVVAAVAIVYSVSTFYYFFPNLVAYTNELVVSKKNAYKILADSNLDWGQGELFLKDYLAKNSVVKIPGAEPEAGKFIVRANDVAGLTENPAIKWLRNFTPVKEVYFSYLIYDISEEDLYAKGLK